MRIVVTTKHLHEDGHKLLAERGADVLVLDQFDDPSVLEKAMAEFDPHGLVSRTMTVTARAIDAAPSLRAISKTGMGYDNIDMQAATRRRIPVMVSFGTNALSVAEHALGLMFALARNIARHDARVRAGDWSRFSFKAHELRGKRLGLVGFGQSAQNLMRLAQCIGMKVSVYSPRYRYETPPTDVARAASLRDLVSHADIVSLHCPLNGETRGSIDATMIAAMPQGAWIINVARGPIVNEADLVDGLASGHLGGAALDTFDVEPIGPQHPLLAFGNVVLTPHVGGSTLQAAARAHPTTVNNLLDALEGRPLNPRAVMNPEVLAT